MRNDPDPAMLAALAAAMDYLNFLSQYRYSVDAPLEPAALASGPPAQRLFQAMQGQPLETREVVARRLAAGVLQVPDPWVAGLLAVQIGGMIEKGMDPVPLADALQVRLPADFAAARRFVELVEAKTGIERPDDVDQAILTRLGSQDRLGASAWAAVQFSTIAAMAVWCRSRPARLAARSVATLVDDAAFLGSRGGYCRYIEELLSSADGIHLIVLAPEQRKGFVVELEAVRNAAHLFALLEDTLVGDPQQGWLTGPRMDPKIAAFARGDDDLIEHEPFPIGWHYEYWWGLHPEGAARTLRLHPLVAAMIGVEATVHNLPEFRGQPLILMRPPRLGSRMCDINFFAPLHDALRSRVTVVRQLSLPEVQALCDELRKEAAKLG